jgi:hypothetical protein
MRTAGQTACPTSALSKPRKDEGLALSGQLFLRFSLRLRVSAVNFFFHPVSSAAES